MGTCSSELTPLELEGVIPRAVREIFARMNGMQDYVFAVRIAFIELYKEQLYDLLSTQVRGRTLMTSHMYWYVRPILPTFCLRYHIPQSLVSPKSPPSYAIHAIHSLGIWLRRTCPIAEWFVNWMPFSYRPTIQLPAIQLTEILSGNWMAIQLTN